MTKLSLKKRIARQIVDPVINAGKRAISSVLPYRPMSGGRDLLDKEYASGVWDYLQSDHELPRFSIIAGYCQCLKQESKILEIGCGTGILSERLRDAKIARYVGVDISAEAIRRARHRETDKVSFVCEDATQYYPTQKLDLILFNECLEYFEDPLGLVRRYEQFLEDKGLFIVSMFMGIDTSRTRKIWKMLDSVYETYTEAKVSTSSQHTWTIKILR